MTAMTSPVHSPETVWAALEAEHAATWRWGANVAVAPKYSDRPHPASYGASLPMRTTFGADGFPKVAALTPAEKKYLAAREAAPAAATTVRPNAPHPASYGAHLPLRGLKFKGMHGRHSWPLAAAEKLALAGRPVVYREPATPALKAA